MTKQSRDRCKQFALILTAMLPGLFFGADVVKADWKSDANDRIEQIRKRDVQITVVNTTIPVQDITVQIQQTRHRFAFGTCIANSQLSNTSYKNFILNHFEWAVCENEAKWESTETLRDSVSYTAADNIYDWCAANGITMRGHCLFWEQPAHVQAWVQSLPYATYPAASELLDEVNERIDSAMNHFKNRYVNWDVNNEMLSDSFYNRLGDNGRVHMFQAANAVDPNCKLFMNEYSGNSFGGYNGSAYAIRANTLISMGAPIQGLGVQGHVASPVNPQSYYNDVLQPLAAAGLPIWVTEYDVDATDVNQRANDLEGFFRICFSHSSVEGIIMWGFWQDSMWRNNAYIVNSDWTLNAAGIRYEALLNEWTTSTSGFTGSSGDFDFRGFHGTYEITLSAPGQTTEVHTITLEPGAGAAVFELQTLLTPPPPGLDVGILGFWATGLTHTQEAGSKRALIFIAHEETTSGSVTLTSVTYGGQPMTKITEQSAVSTSGNYVAAFILNEAQISAAENSTFVPTWSGTTTTTTYASVFLSTVNQINPVGAKNSASTTTSGTNTIATPTLSTNDGDMVILGATCGNGGSYTVNNGFTEGTDQSISPATGHTGVTGRKSATGKGEIPSVTHTGANRQALIGFVIQVSPWLYGDITDNGIVDEEDLLLFIEHWMTDDCSTLDLNSDCRIDLFEMAQISSNWLL